VDAHLSSIAATPSAQWLAPSQWPDGSAYISTPRPFRLDDEPLPMITRYFDVRDALLDPDIVLNRSVPFSIMPADERHRTFYASWNLDGAEHASTRQTLNRINIGFPADARQYIRAAARTLLAQLMREAPPWNLSGLIYEVSMQTVVRHVLQAPMLVPHVRRLRELIHKHVTDDELRRDVESEQLLMSVVEDADDLPPAGVARHLVDVHRTRPETFTIDHLIGQLWMMIVSSETQATQLAALIGMLLETGNFAYARSILDDDMAMKKLLAESSRRAIVFPVKLFASRRPITLDGQELEAFRPFLISYAAANLDPDVFPDPLTFDPRVADSFGTLPRTEEHGMSSRSFTSFGSDKFRAGWTGSSLPTKVQDRLDLVMQGTSYTEVRERFDRYGLLDDQVRFLPGWFHETLPGAPVECLALLRLDGDFYDSTYVTLENLYPRLSTGGYVIVDDYGSFPECKQAVHDYQDKIGISPEIIPVNEVAVYWQKRD
jgi:cytochrome P450